MALTEQMIEARARRAYELGRLRWSLRIAPFVATAAAVAWACGRPAGLVCALACALLPLAAGLSFAGGSAGNAVIPGLWGGAAALALPLLLKSFGDRLFGAACMSFCLPVCVIGGIMAGAVIGAAARQQEREAPFFVSALAIAGLMGALGCTLAGLAGVGGMLAGALVAGTPLVLLARRS